MRRSGTFWVHPHVRWALSVEPGRLRFDYAAEVPPTSKQLREIEIQVNKQILRDTEVTKEIVPIEEARRRGADMFFGEKYGERVRVVSVPGFSTELCGGCHVPRTGEIGLFKIVSDRGIAAGQRRIEAVTSLTAVDLLSDDERILLGLVNAMQASRDDLLPKWLEREERLKQLEREVASLKLKLASGDGGGQGERIEVGGVPIVTRIVEGLSIPELRNLSDTLRVESEERRRGGRDHRRGEGVGHHRGDGRTSRRGFPRPRSRRGWARPSPGSGGGKPDLAQAGGKSAELLPAGLTAAAEAVRDLLANPA